MAGIISAAESMIPVSGRLEMSKWPRVETPTATGCLPQSTSLEVAVDYILDDCFFAIGQAVASQKTVDQAAVIWWRDRYHAKFLRTLQAFGNTWLEDRGRVIATVRLLGKRAVHYAGSQPSIDLGAAKKASRDVERYCARHAVRRGRRLGGERRSGGLYAGYYCTA